jgi:hypothetical protein
MIHPPFIMRSAYHVLDLQRTAATGYALQAGTQQCNKNFIYHWRHALAAVARQREREVQ